jgi:mRNA-degrading endonuclease toxin of MazEF toxin-antitoxin module
VSRLPQSLRGAIVWAISPFTPQAPVRLWGGRDQPVATVATTTELARLVSRRRLDPEQTFLAPAKLRPVVILQDRPRRALREYAALRVARLEQLDPDRVQAVRGGADKSLFYLPLRPSKYGMTKEGAIDLNSLVRIHETAIAGTAVGRLDEGELRVVGERLAEHLDIDLSRAVERRARELLEAIAARHRPG